MWEEILIMERDAQVRRYMKSFLTCSRYRCTLTENGKMGLETFYKKQLNLVVVSMELEDLDGINIIEEIRRQSEIPIIATSCINNMEDKRKVEALDCGADDYIIKPFGEKEFLARIRARLRRAIPGSDEEQKIFQMGHLTVDFNKVVVMVHDSRVHFTPVEYRLLSLLIRNRGKPVAYEQMDWELYGRNIPTDRYKIRVHLNVIRHKIDNGFQGGNFIITVPGIGYEFVTQ